MKYAPKHTASLQASHSVNGLRLCHIFNFFISLISLFLICCFTFVAKAQSIGPVTVTVTSVNGFPACANATVSISFTVSNASSPTYFNASTIYTAYLSNSSGTGFVPISTFTSAVAPGPSTSATITQIITIPATTSVGVGYRIAVGSTGPTYNNSSPFDLNASAAFPINEAPVAPIGFDFVRCGPGPVTFAAAPFGSGETIDWYVFSGNDKFSNLHSFQILQSSDTTFYAKARNIATGCISATRTPVKATINPIPTVTVNSPTVCAGSSATITATPSTAGPYTFAWTVPAGASAPGNVASFNTTIAGTYSVVITNPSPGCSASGNGTMTFNPPTVTVNSPTLCAGSTAKITATPGTAGTYNYSWTVPAGASPPGNFASFSTSVAGLYSVVITNTSTGCVSASASGTVTLNNPINITTQPASQADCKGNSVDFTVSYSAPGTVSYQWQSSTDNGVTWIPIIGIGASGSTSTSPITYSATNIGVSGVNLNGTQYRVIITDPNGCIVTSTPAILTVNEITSITPGNTSTVLCESGSFSFTVATSGNAPTSYQWKKNGVSLTNGTVNGVITNGATSSTLTITNSSPSETGSYQVTVVFPISVPNNNGAGVTSCTETSTLIRNVTVNPKPKPIISHN